MTAMSPGCAELYGSRRTTMARTKGLPSFDRSAASCRRSARIFNLPGEAFDVGRHVEVGERFRGPGQLQRLAAVLLHHPLAATVSRELAQLRKERAAVERRRGDHAAV